MHTTLTSGSTGQYSYLYASDVASQIERSRHSHRSITLRPHPAFGVCLRQIEEVHFHELDRFKGAAEIAVGEPGQRSNSIRICREAPAVRPASWLTSACPGSWFEHERTEK